MLFLSIYIFWLRSWESVVWTDVVTDLGVTTIYVKIIWKVTFCCLLMHHFFLLLFYVFPPDIYYDVKPVLLYEAQACSCKIEDGANKSCGEDCINRMIYTECSPEQCPCQDKCSNQRIQRHEWAPGLEKYMTKDKVC